MVLDFAARTQTILGDQFLGFYLYGSLALGDYDPETSDIDWIVATRGEISEDLFIALQEMHADFERSGSPWAGKIEAAYIPQAALNHPAPTTASYPQLEKGTQLFRAPLEIGWSFQRYVLREYGLVVAGPGPGSLIDPVDPAELKQTAAIIARSWQEQLRQDPTWIPWVKQRSNLSFVVLTLCRLIYCLETGAVISKPAAARWVRAYEAGRWDGLIQRSLAGQHNQEEVPKADLAEMLTMLSYTVVHFSNSVL